MPMQYDPAQLLRIYRQPPLRASRIIFEHHWEGAIFLKHVSKCWASLYTERAVTYQKMLPIKDGQRIRVHGTGGYVEIL